MSGTVAPSRLTIADVGNVCVVTVVSERLIFDQDIQQTGDQLYTLAEAAVRQKILLNFGPLKFMGPAMIAKLFTFHKKVMTGGGTLKFCSIDPDLRVVFKITGFERLVGIYEDEQAALDSF